MFKTILIPIDPAEPEIAGPAIEAATMLARSGDATMRLLSVQSPLPGVMMEYLPPDFETRARNDAESLLKSTAGSLGLDASRVSTIVRIGAVHHEILEEAKACGADLIVMSSHRPGLTTYLLGSNAAHVVRYALCSVLVVRR